MAEDWLDLGEVLDFSSTTFVWVGRMSPSGTQWIFGDAGVSANNLFRISATDGNYSVRFRGPTGGPIDLGTTTSEASTYHIATVTLDSTGSESIGSLYVNGSLATTLASGGYHAGTWMATPSIDYETRLGKHPDSSSGDFLDGEVAEVLVFARPVTEQERRRLECYLRTKYGVSGPEC